MATIDQKRRHRAAHLAYADAMRAAIEILKVFPDAPERAAGVFATIAEEHDESANRVAMNCTARRGFSPGYDAVHFNIWRYGANVKASGPDSLPTTKEHA